MANLVEYIRNQASRKTVLVIDANSQRPNLHNIFRVANNSYGLLDVLNNRINLGNAMVGITRNMSLLPFGNIKQSQSGGLDSEDFLRLMNECKNIADYILIDCPPVLSSSDSMSIAPVADITYLAIQSIKVHRQVVQKGLSLLQNNECEMGGVILNRVQQVIPGWVYKFI